MANLNTVRDYLLSSSTDIHYLLQHTLAQSSTQLYSDLDYKLTALEKKTLTNFINKRTKGIPLAYLTNKQPFYHLDFYVNKNVLIPRADTELLVDITLNVCSNRENLKILDLATGSGIIAITLADKKPNWQITATDISKSALRVAVKNSRLHRVKIKFILSNWFDNIDDIFDIIIVNPPYIDYNDKHLKELVYEPNDALVASSNGLEHINNIIKNAPNYLTGNGILLLEHGYTQSNDIIKLLSKKFYNIKSFQDLSDRDRAFMARIK